MKHFFWLLLSLVPALTQAQEAPKAKPSPYDSAHFSWRKPVPRNRLRELQPDRPGVTESPFTVDAGHVQLEMDALRLRNGEQDGQRQREWHVAYSMLKLGLSRRTDLQLEMPLYSTVKQRPNRETSWQDRHAGFGDITLRVKHNFVGDEQDGRLALAAIGYVRLPSGGQAGAGAVEYGVALPLDLELSDQANLEAQLEADLNYDRETAGRYVRLAPSVALEYDFTDKLGLVTEAVALWDTQQRRWLASVNVAPIVKLTENIQLDLGTHVALNHLSDDEYFVGLTLRR